jgi:fibronectin-binding autotransporter adhesin
VPNLTRINNNQITAAVSGNAVAGINAASRIQSYTITSTKLANSLVYGSDLTISGNLTVNGNTTIVNTVTTVITDPLVVFADGQTTGTPTLDIGVVGLRGNQNSSFIGWKENASQFVAVLSNTDVGGTNLSNTTININSYADFKANSLIANSNLSVTGTTSLTGNVLGTTSFTANIIAGNILTPGIISATGNITASASSFFIGNGSQLTGVTASQSGFPIVAGTSNIAAATNGNIAVTVGGTANVLTVTSTGIVTSGTSSVSGNITGGNLLTAGLISATSTITSAANITGGNILTAGIMSSTGNAIHGNILTAGLISATSTITSAANITGGNLLTAGLISGASNITGGNILTSGVVSATGNISGANILPTGNIIPTANVTYTLGNATNQWKSLYISGNTIYLGNIQLQQTTANTLTVTQSDGTTGANVNIASLSATANVIGGNVTTAGLISATSTITSAANITGGNLLTAGLISATGGITSAATVQGATVSATANVIGGNITTVGLISATGGITSAATVQGLTVSATGNVIGGNVTTVGLVSVTGNVTGGNILTGGLVSASGNITSATNVNTPNVVATANLSLKTSGSGNILLSPTSGNVVLNGTYINGLNQPVQDTDAASKIYVDNLVSTQINYHTAVYAATTTTLATATGGTITYTQPNGVSNGIGAYISTTGSFNLIDTANVQTANTRILVKNEGNAAFNGVYTWSNATTIVRSTDTDEYGPNSSEQFSLNDYFFVSNGSVNKGSAWVVSAPTGTITFGTSNIAFSQFSSSQTYTAGNAISINGTVINALYDNSTIGLNGSNQLYIPANAPLTTPNIGAATGTSLSVTGTVTASTLSATANVIGGNVTTAGLISATGNVTSGNLLTGGLISATGNATVGNISATNHTGTTVSVTGNVTGGNVTTAGLISATGNVTGGNLLTGGLISSTGAITTASTVSATANITGGNILTAGLISAAGNITANPSSFFIGNGSQLTGVTATSAGFPITAGTSNIAAASNGNIGITVGGASNIGLFTINGLTIVGNISANGNVVGGNINTAGIISATANITGGNILTAGLISSTGGITSAATVQGATVSATANVIGGNITTVGLISATGNVIGGNVTTAGLISATGNVIGGNVTTAGLISATSTITSAANITGGNILTAGIMSSTGNAIHGNILTAGLISSTGTATHGNIQIGPDSINDIGTNQTIRINSGSSNTNFAVNGLAANVFFVNAASNTASFGNSTQVANALVAFNTASSIVVPVGNVSQRPGGTPTTGMTRFNTDYNSLEIYNNTGWANVGTQTFTVVADEQITTADGSTVTFPLTGPNLTTNTCIVSINGIVQIPTSAYSISGNSSSSAITFTEAPAVGDLVDVRELTTTTTVTGLQNGTSNITLGSSSNISFGVGGTANVMVVGTGNLVQINGDLTVTGNATLTGNILGDRIQNGTTLIDIQVASGNANVTIGGTSNVAVFANTGAYITGLISATGNITGNYLFGNGSLLTGIITSVANINSGTSNVTVVSSGGNITTGIGGTSNVVVVATTGQYVTGVTSVSGNVTGGNLLTAGIISTAGNIITGTNGALGIGTAAPDCEVNILANPQTVSYPVTGNSTTLGSDLHISGANGQQTRIVQDSFGAGTYVAFTGRAAQGTAASPTATLSGDTLAQFTARGFSSGTLQFGNSSTGRMDIVAAENFTDTSRATNVQILTTASGAITPTAIATFSSASGLSVAGNVTGGNILAGSGIISTSGNITGGNLSIGSGSSTAGSYSATGNITGGNINTSGTTGVLSVNSIIHTGTSGSGNIGATGAAFNTVFATATTALYADLAEKYVADADYAPGTVLVFGGTAEVTVDAVDSDRRVAGVVSTDPGFIMNEGLEADHVAAVALTGRVPCFVIGPVRKGDLMVSAGLGRARAEADPRVGTVIGKALEDFDGAEGTIEVVVGRF